MTPIKFDPKLIPSRVYQAEMDILLTNFYLVSQKFVPLATYLHDVIYQCSLMLTVHEWMHMYLLCQNYNSCWMYIFLIVKLFLYVFTRLSIFPFSCNENMENMIEPKMFVFFCSKISQVQLWMPKDGGGETGSMYVVSYELHWCVHIYITLWYVHVPRTDQSRPRYSCSYNYS